MWKDANNSMDQIFINLTSYVNFPVTCPICLKNQAHIYMHLYDDVTRRGGLWIWCSACLSFIHGSVYVPKYWDNCSAIELEKLTAFPTYLESERDTVDEHTNLILKRFRQQ